MSVVGIDVGRSQHVAAVCRDQAQEAERGVLRVASGREGFDQLDAWMARQGEVALVVMESSGHYWMPLASHLWARGQSVAVVNPLRAKYFAKSRLQRTKSDPADARMLAVLGMSTQPTPREPLAGGELREASRFVMTLVQEQAKVCQRLQRLIDLGFPELGMSSRTPAVPVPWRYCGWPPRRRRYDASERPAWRQPKLPADGAAWEPGRRPS